MVDVTEDVRQMLVQAWRWLRSVEMICWAPVCWYRSVFDLNMVLACLCTDKNSQGSLHLWSYQISLVIIILEGLECCCDKSMRVPVISYPIMK